MICAFCIESVLGSDLTWDYHHRTLNGFRESVAEECVFCRQLATDVGDDGLHAWFDSDDKIEAIYRWTLRRSPKIRESHDVVTLTFRPVRELRDAQGKLLPDRAFYLFPSEDLGHIPAPDRIGPRTDSDESWSQIIEWVDNCDRNHAKCVHKHLDKDFVPTRLLDVGPSQSKWPPDFVLVVDSKAHGIHGPYVTLSHCWGLKSFVRLTDVTKAEFMNPGRGVPWGEIAQNMNFADAIKTARKLNVRYIWIDSLCIIQGQDEKVHNPTDFQLEAPLMHRVYRNSYCNIAASDSEDKDGGLFRPLAGERDATMMVPPLYTPRRPSPMFGTRKWRVVTDGLWQEQVLSKILYTRGWVFQERLLAPRLIHFSHSQIFFDCCTLTASETLPSGLPLLLDTAARVDRHWRERLQQPALSVQPRGDQSLEQLWRFAVAFYTRCKLTVGSDKLHAIWGVAKLVRDALQEDFGAGLWAEQLAEQLAWRVVQTGRKEKGIGRPEDQKGFPSWSWASVKGEVEVGERILGEPRCYVVTGHDGEAVRFTLEEPLHRGVDRKRFGSPEDLVGFMDRNVSALVMREREWLGIQGLVSNTQGETVMPALGFSPLDNGGQPGSSHTQYRRQSAHNMPVLKKPATIAITGHIVRGTLGREKGSDKWVIKVSGLEEEEEEEEEEDEEDDDVIEAFPDEILLKEDETAEYDFVVLAASNSVYSGKEEDEFLEEEDLADAVYSGVGIIVEHVNDANYRRIGSLKFSGLSYNRWNGLRRGCCQRERDGQGNSGLHDLDEGQQFWLQ